MRTRPSSLCVLFFLLFLQTALYAQNKKPAAQNNTKPPAQTVSKTVGTIGSNNTAPLQSTTKTVLKNNPFSKGNWSWTHKTVLDYTNYSETPGQNIKSRSFNLVIDPSYFFLDHFAIGLEARVGSTYHKPSFSKFSSWQADLTLTYGRQLSDRLNLFAKIAAGPGSSRSIFDISTAQNSPQTTDADYFDIKGTVGAPFSVTEDGFGYITPYIYYDRYKTKLTAQEFTTTSYAIGIRPQTYINCTNMKPAAHGDVSKSAYLKGKNFLENNSALTYSHNTQVQSGRGDIIRGYTNFYLGYEYYFIDNLAGGLNLSATRTAVSNPGTAKDVTSDWMIQPVATAHLPSDNAAHNLFLQAAYGFGGQSVFGLHRKTSDLFIKAGCNHFISKNLALTPKIGFERTTQETTTGSSKGLQLNHTGLAAEIGIRTWLNFKRKK